MPCFSGSVEPWNVWQVIMIKAIIPCHARCPWPVNHDITCQTFHGSTDPEKHGTDVSFTNSLNHCPQRYPTTTYVVVGYHEKCTHSANNGYDHIAQVVSIVLFFLTTMVLKLVCEIHVCAKFSIFIMLWYAQVWLRILAWCIVHCEIGGTKGPRGSVSARGAKRRVHWRIRVAPECLRSHNARYIMLKSNYDMSYLVLIHYEAEICKRSSEAGGGESCIVENLCMVL